ncbi:MAG: XRE family transcriptional regulator [Leptospirales bacterium]
MKSTAPEKLEARNATELAEILGLDENDAAEMEFRADLNIAIVKKFKESGLTHLELSKIAKVSRTRLTALLNYNCLGSSTDFMLKVLSALGYKADLKISKIAS